MDCAAAGDGVTAYYDGDYGDETSGVGDCVTAGYEGEGYEDDGGCLGGSDREEWESWSA